MNRPEYILVGVVFLTSLVLAAASSLVIVYGTINPPLTLKTALLWPAACILGLIMTAAWYIILAAIFEVVTYPIRVVLP